MLLIDSNIFLEVLLEQERSGQCSAFLRKILEGKIQAIIPDFSVDSIALIMDYRKKSWKDIRTFLAALTMYKGLYVYSVSLEDKIKAAELMDLYSLDFEDSVILQSMLSNNIEEIVSLDSDFDRVKGIRRILP